MNDQVTLNVSKERGARLERFWCSTGFTPAWWLLEPEMRQTVRHLGSIPFGGIRHARPHWMLDLVSARGLSTEKPVYDWSRLDAALDLLLEARMRPIFELMGNPGGFFSDFNDRGQLEAWRRLVRDLARHLGERYGAEELRAWWFETWNEPDHAYWWPQWPADIGSFLAYYDACSEGLREADSRLRFGGPGNAKHLSPLFRALLEHCDSGVNSITGERGVRIDFISVHEKGGGVCMVDAPTDSAGIVERSRAVLEHIRTKHPRFAALPLINNECDPVIGWEVSHTSHARAWYAAWLPHVVGLHQRELVERDGVKLALLGPDHGFLGHWGQRSLLASFGGGEKGRRERFALVKKPIFNATLAMALLGEQLLRLEGESPAAAVTVLPTLLPDGAGLAVLVSLFDDDPSRQGRRRVKLRLPRPAGGVLVLTRHAIEDGDAGDAFAVWARSKRIAVWDPWSAELGAKMRRAENLAQAAPPRSLPDAPGAVELEFEASLPSVQLVRILVRPDVEPEAISGLALETYAGMEDATADVMLRWEPSASHALRTYEIWHAPPGAEEFQTLDTGDLLCAACVHTRPVHEEGARYRVRAVDWWGRAGPFAEIRWPGAGCAATASTGDLFQRK